MGALETIATGLLSTMRDVLPIAAIIFGFQFLVIRKAPANLVQVLASRSS